MPYIPLVPFDPDSFNAAEPGFMEPDALHSKYGAAAPGEWRPDPRHVRPESYPTPLALARSTVVPVTAIGPV